MKKAFEQTYTSSMPRKTKVPPALLSEVTTRCNVTILNNEQADLQWLYSRLDVACITSKMTSVQISLKHSRHHCKVPAADTDEPKELAQYRKGEESHLAHGVTAHNVDHIDRNTREAS
jgi:hypothetical protein